MLLTKENAHGGDVYSNKAELDFSANVSMLGTPQKVIQAIIDSANNLYLYPDPYCKKLREKISQYEKADMDNIICGNGAADLIFAFAMALKPQKALIVAPAFLEYTNALQAAECQIEEYLLKEENDFELDNDIFSYITKETDVVFVCNPNNPTGNLHTKEFMGKLAKHCQENNTTLFCDECFMDLTQSPKDFSITDLTQTNKNIFLLKAFTKGFGMAGVRLGYGISSNIELLGKMSRLTQVWNVSTLAQNAGVAALECTDFLQQIREISQQEKKYLTNELTKLGFKVYSGKANFLLFKGEENLYSKLMKNKIMIRCCGNFSGLDSSYYRIAVKTHQENEKLIQAIKERNN